MTEVAIRTEAEVSMVTPLTVWANSARQAATVAVSLARTPFVPQSLRDRDEGVTAANITAAILTGQEIGLEPMAALRSIDLIQGTPALRAVALRAVVLAAGHDMWVAESTQTRAVVRGIRKGSSHEQESVWTLDRARGLGLLNKDNWKKQPGAMLVARATGECARLVAADALLGVPYAAEELDDGIETGEPEPARPKARTAQRRSAQAPAVVRPDAPVAEPDPEPDFDEPDGERGDEPDAAEPENISITDAQQRKFRALLAENNITERPKIIELVSRIVQREVESSKDLSKDEASDVIESLQTGAWSLLMPHAAEQPT
jgi:hypothetical protein